MIRATRSAMLIILLLGLHLCTGCGRDGPTLITPDAGDRGGIAIGLPPADKSPRAKHPPDDHVWNAAKPVSFTTLEHYRTGPYPFTLLTLVQSAEEWNRAVVSLAPSGTFGVPIPGAPDVDWGNESIVLASMGLQPNTCFHLQILEMRRHGSTLLVQIGWTFPARGSLCQQTITAPHQMVRIARQPGLKRVREVSVYNQ